MLINAIVFNTSYRAWAKRVGAKLCELFFTRHLEQGVEIHTPSLPLTSPAL